MGELVFQPGVGVGQRRMVLDDVQGGCDGLLGELLEHIVKARALTCDVAGNEIRLRLQKPFNRAQWPEGGDLNNGVYQMLLGRLPLLRVCREELCA